MPVTRTMRVGRIDDQGDRLVLYPASPLTDKLTFRAEKHTVSIGISHVIASVEERENIKDGDMILFEPAGGNFGWFISKSPSTASQQAPSHGR